MALTREQSISKYGTEAYTAWGEAEAQADYRAKQGGAPAPQPTPQPTAQPTNYSTPSSGGSNTSALVQALVSKGYNQIDAQNAANGPRAAELAREYLGVGASGGSVDISALSQPTINLPEIYQGLYSSSGISAKEEELAKRTEAFNAAKSKISDNPYLSEADRVGRIQKIQTDYNNSIAGLQTEIATKKADIETQLNLQSQQFNINSQQAQQALNVFNTLLSSGALDNASGSDIASITRSTGLSSSAIQSAIQSNKVKNYQTTIQSFDDGSNQGVKIYTLDAYGNIVNTQTEVLGPSAQKGTSGFDFGIRSGHNPWELYTPTSSDISSGWNQTSGGSSSASGPQFSPAGGTGSTYRDPATGATYQFINGGWQRLYVS